MTRNLRTLAVAAALAFGGLALTADKASAQWPGYGYGYSPYGGGYYAQSYSAGYANPFVGGYGYSQAYQSNYYVPPATYGFGYYPTAPSNIWTGSYYVSPHTYRQMYGRGW